MWWNSVCEHPNLAPQLKRHSLGGCVSHVKHLVPALAMIATIGRTALGQAAPLPQDLFLTMWQPPTEQRCEVLNKPLPMPSAVFDTARLYQHLAGRAAASVVLAWAPPDTAWREVFGPRPDSMAIIESTATDTEANTVRDALLATLNRSVTIPLLVRIDMADHAVLRVAPALVCRPASVRGTGLQRYEARLRSLSRGPHRAIVGFVVRADGSVTSARLRTSSGDLEFDAGAVHAVSLLQFRPGLLNRVPIPVFVAFPVEVR